jgi:hypothetical protein
MCKVTKQDKAKAVDDDDKIEAAFEMDANMLYMEVSINVAFNNCW